MVGHKARRLREAQGGCSFPSSALAFPRRAGLGLCVFSLSAAGCSAFGPTKNPQAPSVGLNLGLEQTQEQLREEFGLTGDLPFALMHAAVDVKVGGQSVLKTVLKDGGEATVELPVGPVSVQALLLLERRPVDWKERCDTRTDGSASGEGSGGGDKGGDGGGALYAAFSSQSYTVTSETSSLDIRFPEVKEVAFSEVFAQASGLPAGTRIVYPDGLTLSPVMDPCDGEPHSEEMDSRGLLNLAYLGVDFPGMPAGGLVQPSLSVNGRLIPLRFSDAIRSSARTEAQRRQEESSRTASGSAGFRYHSLGTLVYDGASTATVSRLDPAADADKDGVSNGAEAEQGTNPFAALTPLGLVVETPAGGGSFKARIDPPPQRGAICFVRIDESTLTAAQKEQLLNYRSTAVSGVYPAGTIVPGASPTPYATPAPTGTPLTQITGTPIPTGTPVARISPTPFPTSTPVAPVSGQPLPPGPPGSYWCGGFVEQFGVAGRVTVQISTFDDWGFVAARGERTFDVAVPQLTAPAPGPTATPAPAPAGTAVRAVDPTSGTFIEVREPLSRVELTTTGTVSLRFAAGVERRTDAVTVSAFAHAPGTTQNPSTCAQGKPVLTGQSSSAGVEQRKTVLASTFGAGEFVLCFRAENATRQAAVVWAPARIVVRADNVTDTTPPVAGGDITFTAVTNNSVTVNWGAANDAVTPAADLEYRVVIASALDQLNTVPLAMALGGTAIKQDFMKSTGPFTLTGLADNTTLYVAVLVRDAARNVALYSPRTFTTAETQPPVPGTGLTFSDFSTTSVRVTWGAAVDNATPAANLQYRLVRGSAKDEVDTLVMASSLTGPSVVLDWSAGALTAVATGLSPSEKSAFAVLVRDDRGNTALYPASETYPVAPPQLTSHTNGQPLHSFFERFTGTCHNAPGVTADVQVASPNPLNIMPVNATCSGGVLGFEVWFPAGSDLDLQFEIITSHAGDGWSNSTLYSLPYHAPCPAGYVGVAGLRGVAGSGLWNDPLLNAGLGNVSASYGNASPWLDPGRDFCVMKYPAKAQTGPSNPEGGFLPVDRGEQAFTLVNVIPDSRPGGRPWTNISQANSMSECAELNTVLFGSSSPALGSFGLISNTQWQVLARSVEATAVNWSGGSVGSGTLARGHSDNVMGGSAVQDGAGFNETGTAKALAHSPNDNNGFYGTGEVTGEQERTRTLPGGQVVWDLGGNVWQWVRDARSGLGIPTADGAAGLDSTGWSSFRNGSNNRFTATTNRIFGSFGSGGLQLVDSQNTGLVYGGPAAAVLRGGNWDGNTFAGLFSVNLNISPTNAVSHSGFRCTLALGEVSGSDVSVPEVTSLRRVDASGASLINSPVTVAGGGNWNLAWDLNDALDPAPELWVQVRRKVSDSPAEFPSVTDPVYAEGFGLTQLMNENGWQRDLATGHFTVHNGKFINYLITATDRHGNRSDVTLGDGRISIENTQSCPPGYIGVAGLNGTTPGAWNHPDENADATDGGLGNASAAYGHANAWLDPGRDFCVMKYPAKAQTSPSNPEGGFIPITRGEQAFTMSNVIPDSRASGRPWTNISQTQALSECAELNTALLGSASPAEGSFGLISNTQWQVLARSAEATAANWSGGSVGNGTLARGHSDGVLSVTALKDGADLNSTGAALSHPRSDGSGFYGTGQATGEQRRTRFLPNGKVVWDLGGNVWQWVRDLRSEVGVPSADESAGLGSANWKSFLYAGSNRFSQTTNRIFGSFGAGGLQLSDTAFPGQIEGGTGGAVLRGGHWSDSLGSGAFSATLSPSPSDSAAHIGFRCSFSLAP